MHADDFRKDLYGIVSGLRDGGYSDDMTLAAIAGMCMNTLLTLWSILSSFALLYHSFYGYVLSLIIKKY